MFINRIYLSLHKMENQLKDIIINKKPTLIFIRCKILQKDFNNNINILNNCKDFLKEKYNIKEELELFDIYFRENYFNLGFCYKDKWRF